MIYIPILTQYVDVNICNSNKKYYISKGYNILKNGIYSIKVSDLPTYSNVEVLVKCDYCGREYHTKYLCVARNNNTVKKVCCCNCTNKKMNEVLSIEYGEDNCSKIDYISKKRKKTCLEKYGNEYAIASKDVKSKIKQTVFDRYGCDNVLQSKEVRNKIIKTTLDNWGVEYPFQNKEYLEKMNIALIDKFGTKLLFRGVSKQQLHISNLFQGKNNAYCEGFYIDCLIESDKIAIEYDGGGHNLCVRLGKNTQEEFDNKESYRENIIIKNGYKILRIISKNDKLPSDNKLIEVLDKAKTCFEHFNICRYNVNLDEFTLE